MQELLQKLASPTNGATSQQPGRQRTRNISASQTSKKLEIKVPVVDLNNRFEDILRMSMEQQMARLGTSQSDWYLPQNSIMQFADTNPVIRRTSPERSRFRLNAPVNLPGGHG